MVDLKIDNSTPVLVLRSENHGGLGVARSLGRLGVPVHVLEPLHSAPVFSSKYCRGRFVWDLDQAPTESSLEFLEEIARKLGRRAVLMPTADTAALFVASNATALVQWFDFARIPSSLALSLYSKMDMHYLARSMGVPTPDAFFPKCRQEALEFAESTRFPIIIKSIQDRKAINEAARTKMIVRTKQELLDSYDQMEGGSSPNVLLQEYIPGGEDANWMFNGYFDSNSECLFGMTGQKIRQWRVYSGCTSLGVCRQNERVAEIVKRFMKGIDYRGILDIGLRYDARDGEYKVFDVNPRIGCTFRLFVSDNGMDVARAMYLDLTGQPVDPGEPIPERRWMVEDTDLAAAFCYWRDRNLSIGQWLKSFRGVQERAFFAADDPRPILKMCTKDFAELFSRLRRTQNGQSSYVPAPLEPPVAKN